MHICVYFQHTPEYNLLCSNCEFFLESCIPIAGKDGYSNGECDCYLCSGCTEASCPKMIPVEDIKAAMQDRYSVTESRHLSVQQASDFIEYLKNQKQHMEIPNK